MSTSNAQAGSKDYAAFIPEIWSTKLQELLYNSGTMMQCVNKKYEGEIKDAGDTVKIRSRSGVNVSTYTGSAITYAKGTPTVQELLIDQQKFWAIQVGDIAQAQSDVAIMNEYIEEAKIQIDLVKDTFLLGKHSDVPAGNIIGTEATPQAITPSTVYGLFVKLAKVLKRANAIAKGKKVPFVVVNPEVEAVLLQAPEFIHPTNAGDTILREGSIGKIAGLDVLVSTNLTVTTGSPNRIYVLAGTEDAITFASQVVKVEKLRDKDTFSDLVRGLYVYGAKTVQPNALAKMIVDATGL